MENLIAAWVLVPSGYQSGPASQYERQFVIGQPIIDRDLAQLESQLKNKSTFSVHLHDAVVWPRGLDALLRAGADVNARNFFGKTPLMMAAHLNRPDAVRVLLENQADVNARTERSTYECGYAIERGQRTALMYAAENAGIETVRLLLAAGADTAVKDSKGNGLEFYMRLNSRFTDVKSVQALVDLAKAPAGPITASFSCEGNTTSIEAAICKDETLRLYDRDIAESYGKLQKRNAPHIKTDQRAWLKERQMCQLPAAEATAGCLQDLMLARSRFLQSMTSEVIESRPPGP